MLTHIGGQLPDRLIFPDDLFACDKFLYCDLWLSPFWQLVEVFNHPFFIPERQNRIIRIPEEGPDMIICGTPCMYGTLTR